MVAHRVRQSKARQAGWMVRDVLIRLAHNSPGGSGFLKFLQRGRPITHRDRSPGSSPAKVGPRGIPVRRELNVLALVKGAERYVYVYDDDSRERLIDLFRDDAADPHLSLSWFDVAVLTTKAREQTKAAADEPPAESRI